ncbi:MAG: thioredoxin family protein [Polyangiales bacterium]
MAVPSIFAPLDFDRALELTTREEKLLVVDFTASWCGPCQIMDRTTWRDSDVGAEISSHGLAIQIDVDEAEALAERLAIRSMPTVIAFRDGRELDRLSGRKSAPELIAWLRALGRGETSLSLARAAVANAPTDVDARLSFAQGLLATGVHDEATREYSWLWQHMLEHERTMYGVKHSYVVEDVKRLIASHPPARDEFVRLRDESAPRLPRPDRDAFADWLSLNEALSEPQVTLEWYDAHWAEIEPEADLDGILENHVWPHLLAAERWRDLGVRIRSPLARIERAASFHAHAISMTNEYAEELRAYALENLRTIAHAIVRALRAADRTSEADAVAARAMELDPSPEMNAVISST